MIISWLVARFLYLIFCTFVVLLLARKGLSSLILSVVTTTISLAMTIAPKTPAQGHWEALKTYFQPLGEQLMELNEFLNYWNVSREELALICDCSVTTVNHWFSQGEHRRVPSQKHKQSLAIAHHIWTTVETEPEYLQILREMYSKNRRRIL